MIRYHMHPANMRRWFPGSDKGTACGLCGWKGVGVAHILCGCRVALEQGIVSYRHDSILDVISEAISRKIESVEVVASLDTGHCPVKFVAPGQPVKKKRKIGGAIVLLKRAVDWKIIVDKRGK